MNVWPAQPLVRDWTPHDPEIAHLIPATPLIAWAANEAYARTTMFLLVALAIRRARASL